MPRTHFWSNAHCISLPLLYLTSVLLLYCTYFLIIIIIAWRKTWTVQSPTGFWKDVLEPFGFVMTKHHFWNHKIQILAQNGAWPTDTKVLITRKHLHLHFHTHLLDQCNLWSLMSDGLEKCSFPVTAASRGVIRAVVLKWLHLKVKGLLSCTWK